MYIDILRRLRDAVIRKRPQKLRTNIWFLLHDNAPTHRSVLVRDILAKNNMTKLEPSPYSPDRTSADFHLFVQLKPALKGRRFCDTIEIVKNAPDELKRLSKHGFQER